MAGDFDGNGRTDLAVVWDRSGPHQVCDELAPASRWHVTLLLGRGHRVQRPLPCDQGPSFCSPAAGDLDGDHRDELTVEACCGAIVAEWRVYRLVGSELRPPTVSAPARVIEPGPLVLQSARDSGTHDGFGCRPHPDGTRILIAWTGRLLRPRHWWFVRARYRWSDGILHLAGVRRFRTVPHGRWPLGIRSGACFGTP